MRARRGPRGTGSEGHVRQRDLRLEAAVRSAPAAGAGRETEARVAAGSGGRCGTPAQLTPRQPPPPQPSRGGARRGCRQALQGPRLGQRRRSIPPAQPGLPHAIPAGKRQAPGKGRHQLHPAPATGRAQPPRLNALPEGSGAEQRTPKIQIWRQKHSPCTRERSRSPSLRTSTHRDDPVPHVQDPVPMGRAALCDPRDEDPLKHSGRVRQPVFPRPAP